VTAPSPGWTSEDDFSRKAAHCLSAVFPYRGYDRTDWPAILPMCFFAQDWASLPGSIFIAQMKPLPKDRHAITDA
jgi:hypothetical protein